MQARIFAALTAALLYVNLDGWVASNDMLVEYEADLSAAQIGRLIQVSIDVILSELPLFNDLSHCYILYTFFCASKLNANTHFIFLVSINKISTDIYRVVWSTIKVPHVICLAKTFPPWIIYVMTPNTEFPSSKSESSQGHCQPYSRFPLFSTTSIPRYIMKIEDWRLRIDSEDRGRVNPQCFAPRGWRFCTWYLHTQWPRADSSGIFDVFEFQDGSRSPASLVAKLVTY